MQAWREAARSRPEWMRSTANPVRLQLGDLILHQGDQRADHQRGAAARDAGQLIAERFAGAGGHDQQHVAGLRSRLRKRLPGWARKDSKPKALCSRSVQIGFAVVAAGAGDGGGFALA